jgi:hypothetical protein
MGAGKFFAEDIMYHFLSQSNNCSGSFPLREGVNITIHLSFDAR